MRLLKVCLFFRRIFFSPSFSSLFGILALFWPYLFALTTAVAAAAAVTVENGMMVKVLWVATNLLNEELQQRWRRKRSKFICRCDSQFHCSRVRRHRYIDWMSWLFICLSHLRRFYWKPSDFSQHWRRRHCGFPMLRAKISSSHLQRFCRRSTVVRSHPHTQTTPNRRVIVAKRKFPVYPNICLFYFHCTAERPKTTAPAMPAWIYLYNKYADIFCRIFAHRLTTTTAALG